MSGTNPLPYKQLSETLRLHSKSCSTRRESSAYHFFHFVSSQLPSGISINLLLLKRLVSLQMICIDRHIDRKAIEPCSRSFDHSLEQWLHLHMIFASHELNERHEDCCSIAVALAEWRQVRCFGQFVWYIEAFCSRQESMENDGHG